MEKDEVTIEPLTSERFEIAAEWFSDPSVNRWLSSFWRGKTFTAKHIAVVNMNPHIRLFLSRYNGEPAGIVGLTNIDRVDRTASMLSLVGRADFRGKRIHPRAVHLLMGFAFDEMHLGSVTSTVMATNDANARANERIGWRVAGVYRKRFCVGGRFVDGVVKDMVPGDLRSLREMSVRSSTEFDAYH